MTTETEKKLARFISRNKITATVDYADNNPNMNAKKDREYAYWERPCAIAGLTSYRYKGRYGWIMIGAGDHADALRSAARSTDNVLPENLQVWDGSKYVSTENGVNL